MSRAFYSDYVSHCLRFYARHTQPSFHSSADKENWFACEKALGELSEKDRAMLLEIYRSGDTIADNVYEIAQQENINQNRIWKMIADLERGIAKQRGLL